MIPVFKPLIGEEEKEAARSVLDEGWLGMGKNVGEFEKNIYKFLKLEDPSVYSCINWARCAAFRFISHGYRTW